MDNFQNLNYRIVECTSEDPDFLVHELLNCTESKGWQSVRFCQYPQEIIFQFTHPVNLRQINILCHEKKIPCLIEFYSYLPDTTNTDNIKSNVSKAYDKIGYIRLDNNKKNNYRSREFRRVFVNTNCIYLKLVLDKNYVNRFNIFNQVMLMGIEFMGGPYVPERETTEQEEEKEKEQQEEKEKKEELIDELCKEKIKLLENTRDEAVKKEDLEEANNIQGRIEAIRTIGKKIYEYEMKKKEAIKNEDFSNAKLCKFEIENLRTKVKSMDKPLPPIKPVKTSHSVDFSHSYDLIENYKNMSNNSIYEESRVNYDDIPFEDRVVPALRKKKQDSDEDVVNISFKGELEELDSQIKSNFELFIEFIEETGLRKIFSKNIIYKEEGIDSFIKQMDNIFSQEKQDNINKYINQTMKLIFILLCDKHPEANYKSLEIFEVLLHKIKELNEKLELNYDLDVTDNILAKIKEKIGDINIRVRKKSIDLYLALLQQEFCDFNNLLNELVEEDTNEEFKKVVKSQTMVIGKLTILRGILDNYNKAINDNLTTETSFPFTKILKFARTYIIHSKSDIRKLSRSLLTKLYKTFGYHKIQSQIETIEERELEKLRKNIPEVNDFLKKKEEERKLIRLRNKSSREKSKEKSREKIKALSSSFEQESKEYFCPKCHLGNKRFKIEKYLYEHFNGSCVMFCHCPLCSKAIEIKKLNSHLSTECLKKETIKTCKRCKEPVLLFHYNNHVKENKCNPAKNPMTAQRCPLCHKDIDPSESAWFKHLVIEKCFRNKRKIQPKDINEVIY